MFRVEIDKYHSLFTRDSMCIKGKKPQNQTADFPQGNAPKSPDMMHPSNTRQGSHDSKRSQDRHLKKVRAKKKRGSQPSWRWPEFTVDHSFRRPPPYRVHSPLPGYRSTEPQYRPPHSPFPDPGRVSSRIVAGEKVPPPPSSNSQLGQSSTIQATTPYLPSSFTPPVPHRSNASPLPRPTLPLHPSITYDHPVTCFPALQAPSRQLPAPAPPASARRGGTDGDGDGESGGGVWSITLRSEYRTWLQLNRSISKEVGREGERGQRPLSRNVITTRAATRAGSSQPD